MKKSVTDNNIKKITEDKIIQDALNEYRDRGLKRGYSLFYLNFKDMYFLDKEGYPPEIKNDINRILWRSRLFVKASDEGIKLSEDGHVCREVLNGIMVIILNR